MQWYHIRSRYARLFALCWLLSPLASSALTNNQQAYETAKQALASGKIVQYHKLRQQLTGYPLSIYLDYRFLSQDFAMFATDDIANYLLQYADTPPGIRLRAQYLHYLAKSKQWQQFLNFTDDPPNATELKCHYHYAQYQTDQQQLALQGAETLWLYGRSRPDSCEPLFKLLKKHHRLTDALIWQRMQLAFKARQRGLMKYLSRDLSSNLSQRAEQLLAVYQSPRKLRQHSRFADDSATNRSIVQRGLEKLSTISPNQALKQWQHYQSSLSWRERDKHAIEQYIGYQALLRHDAKASAWLDKHIERLANDKLIELRLRRALKAQQWQLVRELLPLLSESKQQSTRWRYWQARVLQIQGEQPQAQVLFAELAKQRSFYGFLAADASQQRYALNHHNSTPSNRPVLAARTQQALFRINELKALDKPVAARSEWHTLLDHAQPQEVTYLPTLAIERGWWDYAITGAIHNGQWNDLQLRFPAPYRAKFQEFARMRQLDESLLLAVARRESSFYTHATSGKNARGLMQLLPGTARQMARKIKLRYSGNRSLYQASTNIRLGSAYLNHLMLRYNNNRVLTAAGYNAGPRNVDNWMNEDLPFDVWIETIPFKETREYVQAILAYRLIYAIRTLGDNHATLLTDKERKAVY